MLPKGWKETTVGEVCSTVSVGIVVNPSHYYVDPSVGIKAFRSQNVRENHVNEENWAYLSEEGHRKNAKSILAEGDVAVVRTGYPGTACVVPAHLAGVNCIDILFARPDKSLILPEYLCELTNSDLGKKQILNEQGGLAQKHLNVSAYEKLSFPLPSLVEQQEVVDMLTTWNRSIGTIKKLILISKKQKQSLSLKLLSGRHRLQDRAVWKSLAVKELIVESRLIGAKGDTAKKITVKLYGKGVVPKSERRSGSDSTQYYQRCAGQFIYSKLDFLNGAFGIIPPELDGYESTLDLPAFDFLPGVDPRWFLYYVSREAFYKDQLGLANGGRKARRVNPADLLHIVLNVPSIDEQRAIADVMDLATQEEEKWKAMLVALETEKRELMSVLLNGERRTRSGLTPELMSA